MRERNVIYIIITAIICIVLIVGAIYIVDNMNSDSDVNNTTENSTTNDSIEENSSENNSQESSQTSQESSSKSNSSSLPDYSDYETGQSVGANGVINLSDNTGSTSYEEHKEWQARQCDKLEADGYYITSSNVDGISNGYDAIDDDGNVVVHINY